MNNLVIGIDIGATNTRLAVLNSAGEVQEKRRIPSQMKDGRPFFDHVAELAADLAKRSGAQVVGVGTAGQIERNSGRYLPGLAPHQPWVGIPIKSILAEKTGLPTFVDNDCKISAYAERKIGQGQGLTDFISLTLGTGIGGGIITNGELVHGEKGLAGHLGHFSLEPEGPSCYCGNRGCLESYVSGTAVGIQATQAFGRTMDSKETFQLANEGNEIALGVIQATGKALGRGLAIMGNLLNPQAFILGGSMLEWYDLLIPSVRESFRKHVMVDVQDTPILQSTLGEDGGIIGAALYGWDQFRDR